jgi:hypothetical protein
MEPAYVIRVLRENGKYLPKQSFMMRKGYFNNDESGLLKVSFKSWFSRGADKDVQTLFSRGARE